MKTKILILILFCTVQFSCDDNPTTLLVKSQSFDKRSSWTEVRTNLFDETFFEISTFKVDSDTLIGGKSYSKLLRNNNFYSALRETEDNKIYVYFPYLDRELLIYDFDWYPNKTLNHQIADDPDGFWADGPDGFYIQAILGNTIDSVQLLDGKYYKYVDRGTFRYGTLSIIRGIGNTMGFFTSTFAAPGDGSQFALLCFYIDDKLVYSNPNFNYCNTSSINIE